MRGEQQRYLVPCPAVPGITPHARGAAHAINGITEKMGITPACAGSSVGVRIDVRYSRDHPRMRGEQTAVTSLPTHTWGSPPHARGAAECPGYCGNR